MTKMTTTTTHPKNPDNVLKTKKHQKIIHNEK